MSWTRVASSAKRATTASTTALSLTIASTAAGNLGVGFIFTHSSTITISSPLIGATAMTSPAGNPVTNGSGPVRGYAFYLTNLPAGATTFSATASSAVVAVMMYEEFASSLGGIALDSAQASPPQKATGNSGALATSSLTPTVGALLVGAGTSFTTTGSWTAGSSPDAFTIDTSSVSENSGSDELETVLSAGGSAETFPATRSVSGQWAALGLSFTETGGAAVVPIWNMPVFFQG